MTKALDALVAATEAALEDASLADDRARAEAILPALGALLADPHPIPDAARQSLAAATSPAGTRRAQSVPRMGRIRGYYDADDRDRLLRDARALTAGGRG